MKRITLFSDGSSLGNPGFGGYCAILRYKNNEKIICGSCADVTNNQMELRAVIEGIKAIKEPCEIEIVSDSNYVLKSILEWLDTWVKKDFKNVKNIDMWKEYLKISSKHKITGTWVKGHVGHVENEKCDKIAKNEALKLKQKLGE